MTYVKQCLRCFANVPLTAWRLHQGSLVCEMRVERRKVKREKLVHVPDGNPRRLHKELLDLGAPSQLLAISAKSGYMGTVDNPRRGVHLPERLAQLVTEAKTLMSMTGPMKHGKWRMWLKVCLDYERSRGLQGKH